jgi:predicted ribosome quality control (RQC) complex YloA/Tae2 family protein
MKLTLSYDKSVHANAARYYELAKESREKAAGLENAIKETEKELEKAKKGKKKEVRRKREKEWYEKFHFASTSAGKLMLGGRNAQQNDLLFAKHLDDADLFFHADIQGASAVVLKGGAELLGEGVPRQELAEAAQFAASFSKAWINGNAGVDVYAVLKSQLSKHSSGGFIPSGAFAISGERTWFRDTKLALRLGIKDGKPVLVPDVSPTKLEQALILVPSQAGKEKGALARSLAKRFGVHPDELLELLPNGRTKTIDTPGQ